MTNEIEQILREKKVDLKLISSCQDFNFYNSLYLLKHFVKNKSEGKLSKDEFTLIKYWLENKCDA